MKIAAIMLVRDEADIIADSVGHLLQNVQVDRLYVADNGSTDATLDILARIAAADGRLSVQQSPGPYRPESAVRALTDCAITDGADWILPTDADEFLWMHGVKLRARLAETPGVGGYSLSVCNFVQFGAVKRDQTGSIQTMLFSAVPKGTEQSAFALVHEQGLPFVRMQYPAKIIVAASPALCIRHGNHYADGLVAPFAAAPLASVLHAPIRSRDDLQKRVAHAKRTIEWDNDPANSWHVKRLAGMDERALDAEWQANSIHWPPQSGFRFDLRLTWLGHRLRRFRRRFT